ncbi:MAG: ATP-dependent zinc metalloprotease FtsH [Planctomycetales bacterium]
MSEPHQPPPDSGAEGKRSRRPRGRDAKRPERQSSNTFWYLMLGLVIAVVVFSFMNQQRRGQKLKYGELVDRLERGTYTADNVHDLKIGEKYITFRDQPSAPVEQDEASDQPVNHFYVPAVGMTDGQKEDLGKLATSKGILPDFEEPPSEWQSAVVLLLPIALVVVLFLFIFRRMGGAGSAMSFGRSRGKLYAQQDIEITFEDVAGIDEAVEELREVVEFLRSPGKYQALGGRIPRGVLLVGPPGTGKTLLAKAVAGEAGVGFFSLSGSDFVEMFVGVGAARVRDMFHQAGAKSPSIIFIDELDALGKVRGSGMPGGHDEREQTLNALLVEMDGFSSDQSVIVMGATNRPETLDPALMRPGRFDRHVLVDRPDIKGRESILKVHAARIKMDDSVDLKYIARLTPGFVGADLANLVNEAALLAARAGKNRVSMKEFEDGIERVVAGLEKTTRIIHEDTKQRVAYHECGHALVACCLPNTDPVHKISIIPRGMGALGYTLQRPEDDRHLMTQSELENRICVLMGGTVAEEIVYLELSTGAQNDLQRATDIARRMVTEFGMSPKLGRVHYTERQRSPFLSDSSMPADYQHSERTMREIDVEVKRVLDEAIQTVRDILSSRRDVLEHMTRDLIEMETMGADHLKRILEEHKTSPQIKPGTFAMPSTAVPRRIPRAEPEPREALAESADGA